MACKATNNSVKQLHCKKKSHMVNLFYPLNSKMAGLAITIHCQGTNLMMYTYYQNEMLQEKK